MGLTDAGTSITPAPAKAEMQEIYKFTTPEDAMEDKTMPKSFLQAG